MQFSLNWNLFMQSNEGVGAQVTWCRKNPARPRIGAMQIHLLMSFPLLLILGVDLVLKCKNHFTVTLICNAYRKDLQF